MHNFFRSVTLLLLLVPTGINARSDALKLEQEGTLLRLQGDYVTAETIQERLINEFDEPIGHTFAINTIVTHLTWDETTTAYDQDLLYHSEKTLNWCSARLDQSPKDSMANYYCGQAHFSLSLLNGVRGNYYRAGRHGTICIELLEAALEADPSLIDAKTYLGLSYYVADNLPPFIKLFSRVLWFIPTGNSEKSLPYLRDVIANGYQYSDVARYIYAVLLFDGDEAEKQEAEDNLQHLVDHYPGNSRFQLRLISLLLIQGKFQRTLDVALAYLSHAEPTVYDLTLVKVWMARAYLGLERLREANELFLETENMFNASDETLPPWSIAWHLLTGAQLHDLASRRHEAKESYAKVLNVAKSTYVHHQIIDAAREGLLVPFTISP